jgi:hypothetical protein
MQRRSKIFVLTWLVVPLALLLSGGVVASAANPGPGRWNVGQDMHETRLSPARTVLGGNRVMVIGGMADGSFTAGNTAEIYNADTNTWSYVAPVPRRHAGPGFAATLPNGNVLYAGGWVFTAGLGSPLDFSESRSAYLFDPSGRTRLPNGTVVPGAWTKTGSLPGLGTGGNDQNAIVTAGTVVIGGGVSDDSASGDAPEWTASRHSFIYDIKAGTWKRIQLNERRSQVPIVKLRDGRVFVAGGRQIFFGSDGDELHSNTAEIYDPAKGSWKAVTRPMPSIVDEDGPGCASPGSGTCLSRNPGSRWGHVEQVLPDGRVLIAGGSFSLAGDPNHVRDSALLFDPSRGTWTRSRHDLPTPLTMAISSTLPDGRVLVAGGLTSEGLDSHRSWIFNPKDQTWTEGASMPCIRLDDIVADAYGVPHGTTSLPSSSYNTQTGATTLANGRVVFSGGFNNEVFGTDWPDVSKRTYVYDPRAPARGSRCFDSALPTP